MPDRDPDAESAPADPHDALFKFTFRTPANAASFLRESLPASVSQSIDWSSLELRPGSYVDPEMTWLHSDLLFSARTRGRREEANPDAADKLLLRYMIHVPEERSVERTKEALEAILSSRTQESAMTIAERWAQEGEERGRVKMLEHNRQQLLHLLQLRYGEVPETFTTQVKAASQDDIDTWLVRLLSAEFIEGVFVEGG